MCQICTIAARYSRHQLDRTQSDSRVFDLSQFSTSINGTRSTESLSNQSLSPAQESPLIIN